MSRGKAGRRSPRHRPADPIGRHPDRWLEDRFYCAHNAVVSAQLGGRTLPRTFDPEFGGLIIQARRHGLTWCLSPGTTWAKTSLDT